MLEDVARSVGTIEDKVMRTPMSNSAKKTLAEQPLQMLEVLIAEVLSSGLPTPGEVG